MWKLGGNLYIARRHNKTLPAWATDDVIDTLIKLRVKKFESQAASSPELTKLSGGPLLGHLLDNMIQFTNGTLFPDDHGQKESGDRRMKDLKLMVFSGHDTNMVFVLSALNLFTPAFWPSYAATLFLELHQIQGNGGGGGGGGEGGGICGIDIHVKGSVPAGLFQFSNENPPITENIFSPLKGFSLISMLAIT